MPQTQKSPPSSEEIFVSKFVSFIVQYVPLGGSGGVFISFLIQHEWMTAIPLFPVTAAAGLWASYSKGLIEQLSKIYGERGREHANALVHSLDSLNQTLKWQFSGFEQQYLGDQAKAVSEYVTEGFNPDRTAIPLLEEVYVPLELSGAGMEALRASQDHKLERSDTLWIWDFLRRADRERQCQQIVIQAKGGFGKTTLLRHVAYIYGQGKHKKHRVTKRIPFLLRLRNWKDLLTQTEPPSLETLIEQYIEKLDTQKKLKVPPQWIEQTLNSGEALVMFDGFDEIPEAKRAAVSEWISNAMGSYRKTHFIITSRPEGYKDYAAQKPSIPLFVKEFTKSQQADFINRWYACQERCYRRPKQFKQAEQVAQKHATALINQLQNSDRPELQQMAANPLLLNMLATYHRFDPGVELPRKRVELYKGICKLQLEDRPRARGIPVLMEREKSQPILQQLALKMVRENRASILHDEILDWWQQDSTL